MFLYPTVGYCWILERFKYVYTWIAVSFNNVHTHSLFPPAHLEKVWSAFTSTSTRACSVLIKQHMLINKFFWVSFLACGDLMWKVAIYLLMRLGWTLRWAISCWIYNACSKPTWTHLNFSVLWSKVLQSRQTSSQINHGKKTDFIFSFVTKMFKTAGKCSELLNLKLFLVFLVYLFVPYPNGHMWQKDTTDSEQLPWKTEERATFTH